jgi:predicted PilT family ATPase
MANNEHDRFAYGFDAGVIVDGVVQVNVKTGRIELIDDDGEVFCPEEALASLLGKKTRLTIVSFEALADMAKMYEAAQSALGKSY